MQMTGKNILVAGMGVTGQSISTYLDSAGVNYDVCDDAVSSGYGHCEDSILSRMDIIFKSPGIPNNFFDENHKKSEIINDIELFLRMNRKPVIFVTGTNGKSTVVGLMEAVLVSCGMNAIACGNNGVPVLNAYSEDVDMYILELSSYQLENISTLSSLSSVVLNIGIDHLSRYKNIKNYQETKERVYTGSEAAVYPISSNKKHSFDGDIVGYEVISNKTRAVYWTDGKTIFSGDDIYCPVENLALSGMHNFLNVCAVLALCHNLDLSAAKILSALHTFKGLVHRLETVCVDSKGRRWVNDSKSTNVHATRAALESFDGPLCLIMGGQSKNESYTNLFSEYRNKISHLILYGIDAEIISSQANIQRKEIVTNVESAVCRANKLAIHDSLILFSPACASFDQYRDFNERGEDFRSNVTRVVSC